MTSEMMVPVIGESCNSTRGNTDAASDRSSISATLPEARCKGDADIGHQIGVTDVGHAGQNELGMRRKQFSVKDRCGFDHGEGHWR